MQENTGLNDATARKSADHLENVLANTIVLHSKTLNFHWNVMGANFMELHNMFQGQYEALAASVDVVAERIRTLGFKAPGRLIHQLQRTSLQEDREDLNAGEMVQHLLSDYQKISADIRTALDEIDPKDYGTRNILEDMLGGHEKTAWILGAHLLR